MVPTLRHGDMVVARFVRSDVSGTSVRVGDVVIARYRSMPERLVVKTVQEIASLLWRPIQRMCVIF